ncbi:Endoplasmic reticulum aminopeptidase 1 [Acipenser ruthenus]|uniref:Endoplasmic reticulum aminopeptidase 1 n=1 Tax=Acipenser ruthenus TaxID=7906 RepID=A0A444V2N9_ACIRT|nr:Endoplasmic reticulum aminopeptidase 1 [Acipenser ruthenus]
MGKGDGKTAPDAFKIGIIRYLRRYSYENTRNEHLWESLTNICQSDDLDEGRLQGDGFCAGNQQLSATACTNHVPVLVLCISLSLKPLAHVRYFISRSLDRAVLKHAVQTAGNLTEASLTGSSSACCSNSPVLSKRRTG